MVNFPSAGEIAQTIFDSGKLKCRDFATAFGSKSVVNDDGWQILQQVFNFSFRSSDLLEPFGPMFIEDGKRSMVPSDLSAQQLDELQRVITDVSDPEFRSRVGDVLWLSRKDVSAARIAVDGYLEAGKRIEDPKSWPSSMERYERAIRLARQIEPKGGLPETVLKHLETRVFAYNGSDPLFFTCKALGFLAEFRFGNFPALAEIAGRVADTARASGDFRRARSYFDVQVKLLKLAKELEKAETANILSAQTFIEEAESREAINEFIAAHSLWSDAITAYRKRPSLRTHIPDLQKRYANAGKRLSEEMHEVSSDGIDISSLVEESRATVRHVPFDDAFFRLISFVPLIDPIELRKATESGVAEAPLHATIPVTIHDAFGRKIGIRPSVITDNKEDYEKAIVGLMEQDAGLRRHLTVHANILPAIRQISEDHDIERSIFATLLGDSSAIPEDRSELFYQAFEAGFHWDFSTALHILIPQVENALRHILEQKGISPVNIDSDGIEEVWGIERVLAHPKVFEAIGPSFVFELKSLLVERLGPNIRNLFAHGALPPNELRGETAVYLWWVVMRLVGFPTSGMKAFLEREGIISPSR